MADTQLTTGKPLATARSGKATAADPVELRDRLGLARPALRPGRSLRGRAVDSLKTVLWVIPLTLLLWIYAEREQLATREGIQAPIEVQSTDPARRIVTVIPDGRGDGQIVSIDLAGPRAGIDAVRERLAAGGKLTVTVPDEPPFNGDIPLLDRIARNDLLTSNAVTVTKVSPPSVHVNVEARTSRALRIRPRQEDNVIGDITFSPAEVLVSGPRSVIDNLQPDQLFVDANMSNFVSRKPGAYDPEPVELIPPPLGDNVTLERQSVTAKVVIKPGEVYRIPSVRLHVNLPLGALNVYHIEGPANLPNVEVSGPRAAIDELREPSRFDPYATITLTAAELAKGKTEDIRKIIRPEDYVMPKGVNVIGEPKEVVIKVVDR